MYINCKLTPHIIIIMMTYCNNINMYLTVQGEVSLGSVSPCDDSPSLINARYHCTLELCGRVHFNCHDRLQNNGRGFRES